MATDRDSHPPTICHVLHSMSVGGAEILARAYAKQVSGWLRVVFACLDECGQLGEQLRDEGYTVEVLNRSPGFDMACVARLSRFLRQQRVELVHAHQYGPFLYSGLSRFAAGRVPILFMEHGRDFPDYPRPKRKVANRFLLSKKDHVVAVGDCVRDALVEHEGIRRDRVEVIYNGIDLAQYDPTVTERESVRQELGLSSDELIVMQVGRLNRLKDHITSVRAMAQLSKDHPRVRLVLVGDGEERSSIENTIDELNLHERVVLLGTRHDVPRLLQAADIFMLSSITEGIPLTLIEAMATGLPCVATRVGGNGEVIVDGETGLLATASDPSDLAAKLRVLVTDPRRRKSMGEEGHRIAESKFDAQQMHRRYEEIYLHMLGLSTTKEETREQANAALSTS